jgi:histidine triad (HIT) family protein
MTEEEAASFGKIMQKVSQALKECEGAEHIYAFIAGDAVPHLHMHIVPRYPGTPTEYWGASRVLDWEEAPKGGAEAIEQVCNRIRTFFLNNND